MCSARQRTKETHARYMAARAEHLDAVAALAEGDEWAADGAGDVAGWLCANLQISRQTARSLVNEAEELVGRPLLREALGAGQISADQCKALLVLGGDDEVALGKLPYWTITELERQARKETARKLERKDGGIYLRMQHTKDERYMRGEFQLHPDDGALVLSALDARVPHGTKLRDWDHASALALVEMAKGSDGPSARPTILLSVTDGDDVARLSSGGFVGHKTIGRLSCDAGFQVMSLDENGRITSPGKLSRNIPAALRRAVHDRDADSCTYEGCGRTRYLECHHIKPVAEGGPTTIDNLLLVCWKHHELVHEKGWSLRGEAGPHITWIRPDGTPFEPRVRVTLDTS